MLEPQNLPGRFGRVIKAIDRVLAATQTQAILAGGWAVWRHGFDGRITQDVDIAIAANDVDEFLRVAAVSGFRVLAVPPGRWQKLEHTETGIEVDLLVEGARPGLSDSPAPTTIPAPSGMGVGGTRLTYIRLSSLIELKLAAGRAKDRADVIELIRANRDQMADIRVHLLGVHQSYLDTFDQLYRESVDPNN